MDKRRVVITGMGVVSCYGTDVEEFYNNLLAGNSGVAPVTSFDISAFPTRFGGAVKNFNPEDYLDKKNARRLDPCIAFAVGAGKNALRNAAVDLDALDKTRSGVLIGSGMGGMKVFSEGVEAVVQGNYKKVSPFFVPYIITNMPGAYLAVELGFKGPNYSISTACATSNFAIHAAADHIRNGHADLMVAGGVEASINPMCFAGFTALKAISRNNDNYKGASKPWDKKRDGFVIGEGCGAIVLESLEHALARGATILAEYKGGSMSCDAHHITEPTPDGSDVARCIESALKDAGLSAGDIDYVNAHATATPVGDLCEIRALKKVFGSFLSKLKVNATKSLIGHALGGAGALEMIATLMAIKTGWIHPTINVDDPEEELAGIDIVPNKAIQVPVAHAVSNSFGFGGHNCVIVISKYIGQD